MRDNLLDNDGLPLPPMLSSDEAQEPFRCPCTCVECRIGRHDICRHVKKCTKRPNHASRQVGRGG